MVFMHHSKLIDCLKNLTKIELKSFQKMVNSSFFNSNKKIIELLKYCSQYYDDWDNKALSTAQLSKNLFPTEKTTAAKQRLREHMSDLLSLFKRFLVLEALAETPDDENLLLLRQLRKRNLNKMHKSILEKTTTNHEKQPYLNEAYYQIKFELTEETEAFFVQNNLRDQEDSLQELVQDFDTYYIAKKLKFICEMLNRGRIVKKDYQLYGITEIEALLNNEVYNYLKVPIIEIHYQIYLSLIEEVEETHFYKLLQLLQKYNQKFSKDEQVSFYAHAQNYCIRKINKGAGNYLQELFKIYQYLLTANLMEVDGFLPHPHYKNIVTVALRLKEFKWTKQLIETYKNKLNPTIRESAYAYNLAYYYDSIKEYDKVINLLNTIEFTDIYYEIGAKYILVKVYYELNEFGLLQYLILSFERLVKRNKQISISNREGTLNFLAMLKKMANLKEQKSFLKETLFQERKKKIVERLAQKKPLPNIHWLREKLEGLVY